MPRTFDLDDGSVVLIIGSGAGGGTLGNELAQKGIRTLILEAGPRIEREQHIDDERQSFAQLAWLDKRTTSGSWRIAKDSPNFPANVCKVVGGTTVHWGGCSLRFQQHEFRAKDVYGDIAGTSLLNWPLTLSELEPYYDKAEDKMGVTGTHGIPLLDADNNQIVMAAGAKKVGYKEYSTGNMAINSRPRDGRPATIQDGFCFQGIRSNAKWSTLNTEIPKGEATGNLEVRPQCHVLRIEHDKSGRVTGVVYADKQSNYHRQRARIVCVAGNSIETPRILLNSASSRYPEGLVNSSGQVGRNYMRHMSARCGPYSINPYGCTAGTRWPAASRTSNIIDRIGNSSVATICRRCTSACLSSLRGSLTASIWEDGIHANDGGLRVHGRHVASG
jgi:choline dehydrogenase-like flavoprotein